MMATIFRPPAVEFNLVVHRTRRDLSGKPIACAGFHADHPYEQVAGGKCVPPRLFDQAPVLLFDAQRPKKTPS
jgi:hypothetical protein